MTLCAQKSSTFKVNDNDSLKSVNHAQQEDELSATAPLLLKCLKAAAYNERALQKNKIKTKEYIQPAIMIAAGILLNCHNKNMNLLSTVISMLLRRGGADKLIAKRLNKSALSLSYAEELSKQSQISENKATKNGQSVPQFCTSTADEMEVAVDE